MKLLSKIMKLTAILLTAAFLHVSAHGLSQQVSLSMTNAPLEKVFREIERQTGYGFLYTRAMLQYLPPVSIDVKNVPVSQVLDQCLGSSNLAYSLDNNTIVITRREPAPSLTTLQVPSPPPGEIHGRVTDSLGNPLVGASVTVKGSKKGTSTDAQGNFDLKGVDGNATLLISFTGFESREIKLNGRNEIAIQLKQGSTQLLDVVVSKGYYTTTNRLNTGDVTTIKGEDIEKQPVSDPIMALEGRVPGLYISQTSGVPGASETIQLRGQNSIANGNNPLYIVDGVPFTSNSLTSPYIGGGALGNPANNGTLGSPGTTNNNNTGAIYGASPFNNLNPADIESIEVLKDADATAIYGSRGANGVILITTKRGKLGSTRVDINVNSGDGTIARKMHLLNTQQYLEMRHEALKNDGLTPGSTDYDVNGIWDTTRYTDWQKVMIGGTAHFTNVQGDITGGNNNTQFLLGGAYSKQTTVFPGNYSDQKGSMYFNLAHASINKRFHALFSASYVNDNNNLPQVDFTQLITLAPDSPPLYNSDGSINWQNNTWSNPIANVLENAEASTDNLIGNLNLDYELLPGLHAKGSFGYTHIQLNQNIISPGTAFQPPYNTDPDVRSNSFASNDLKTWIIEPQINYGRVILGGKLDAIVGTTFQQNVQNSIAQTAYGFSSDALIQNISAATSVYVNGSDYTQYKYDALFGRVGYDWKDRYLLNLTARRDGSSRFGPGKQFGNFGAIGTGWIFSNETFVKRNLPFLSFGKLKASFGTTGNDQITNYQYLSTYSIVNTPYQGITGLSPTQLPNSDFAWEVDKKLEGGINIGVFKNRLLIDADYYRDWTKNQLVGYSLPTITGFTTIQANLPANIQNTGFEVGINSINLKSRQFTWTSSFNLSAPRNKLISYQNLASSSYSETYAIGKPLYIQFLPHNTGVNPNNGLFQFQNGAHSGDTTSPSLEDYQFHKSVTQKFYGGFDNSFSYNGFQFDVFFQFVNQTGYNYLQLFSNTLQPGMFGTNVPTYFLGRWQKPGDITEIQKFSTNYLVHPYDAGISSASFIRLKNLQLSYTLPGQWQRKAHMQNAKIYLQAQNLLTITKYNGMDPEALTGTAGQSLPPMRMITMGFQIGL